MKKVIIFIVIILNLHSQNLEIILKNQNQNIELMAWVRGVSSSDIKDEMKKIKQIKDVVAKDVSKDLNNTIEKLKRLKDEI
jgi:ATP-dependent protease ClpP protease subunit